MSHTIFIKKKLPQVFSSQLGLDYLHICCIVDENKTYGSQIQCRITSRLTYVCNFYLRFKQVFVKKPLINSNSSDLLLKPVCIVSDHVREFTCGKMYYRTLYLDEKRDALYVGAM